MPQLQAPIEEAPQELHPQMTDTDLRQLSVIQNAIGGLIGGLGNTFPIELIQLVIQDLASYEAFWDQMKTDNTESVPELAQR